MLDRLDADHDGTVSRSEVRAAAGRKYDLIASKNGGHVTSVALSGRLTKDALQDIQAADAKKGGNAEPDSVTRNLYLAQADKAFGEAHIMKKGDATPGEESLTLGELSAPSAKNSSTCYNKGSRSYIAHLPRFSAPWFPLLVRHRLVRASIEGKSTWKRLSWVLDNARRLELAS